MPVMMKITTNIYQEPKKWQALWGTSQALSHLSPFPTYKAGTFFSPDLIDEEIQALKFKELT